MNVAEYRKALALRRAGLDLTVTFKPDLHPRGLDGRWRVKSLSEGLSTPVKAKQHQLDRQGSNSAARPEDLMAPFRAVQHKDINLYLRTHPEYPRSSSSMDSARLPWGVAAWIAGTDLAMHWHTLKRDRVLLRAVPEPAAKDLEVGSSWVDQGFVSTSFTEEGVRTFIGPKDDLFSSYKEHKPVFMKISVPAGTHAYDWGANLDKGVGYRELTLDRGLKYTVTGEERDPDGNRVLLVQVGEGPPIKSLELPEAQRLTQEAKDSDLGSPERRAIWDANEAAIKRWMKEHDFLDEDGNPLEEIEGSAKLKLSFDPNLHPRGPKGRWVHNGDKQVLATLLRQFVMGNKRPDWKYENHPDYILHEGRFYQPGRLPEDSTHYIGEQKMCYKNAMDAAVANPKWTYVEGYAKHPSVPFPVEHAWVADERGRALELTWPEVGTAYIGIPFTNDEVLTSMVQTGQYGMFGSYGEDYINRLKGDG